MKINSGISVITSRMGVGMALFVFCAFAPLSRAEIIIDNLGDSPVAYENHLNDPLAQVFTMSGTSGGISGLTLGLNVGTAGSATIDLYSATSGGAPIGFLATLGTVTAGATGPQNLTVGSLNNYSLTAGATYAVVLETPTSGQMDWVATSTSGSGGTGTLGGIYYYNGSSWVTQDSAFGLMNLQTTPVPEVPMTGVVVGFGSLAMAGWHGLRRKLHLSIQE